MAESAVFIFFTMHDSRWEKILQQLSQKYTLVERTEPTLLSEDATLMKETVIFEGSQGKTRFERYTRVPVEKDPLHTAQAEDWLFSERAITSYVRAWRLRPDTDEWEEFDARDIFFKT